MTQPIPLHVLCAYLPYNTKIHGYQSKLSAKIVFSWENGDADICLLLRPLSDLSKPLPELQGKTALEKANEILGYEAVSVVHYLNSGVGYKIDGGANTALTFLRDIEPVRELLLSLHFDLFGAIQQGWALDLNQSPS